MSECSGLKSSSSRATGSPLYAIHRHTVSLLRAGDHAAQCKASPGSPRTGRSGESREHVEHGEKLHGVEGNARAMQSLEATARARVPGELRIPGVVHRRHDDEPGDDEPADGSDAEVVVAADSEPDPDASP